MPSLFRNVHADEACCLHSQGLYPLYQNERDLSPPPIFTAATRKHSPVLQEATNEVELYFTTS